MGNRGDARQRMAVVVAGAAAVTLVGSYVIAPPSSAAEGLTITVVNNNPDFSADEVFVVAQAGGTEVVADPQPLSSRESFVVPSVRSGRVFVSLGDALPAHGEPSPDTSQVRYDAVELTYPGVANLTAVDMFGIPLDLEVFDADGQLVGAKRWGCYTDVVRDALAEELTAAGGDFSKTLRLDSDDRFLRVVSPNIVSGLHPSGYPTFENYVGSLAGVPLRVRGTALGESYDYVGAFRADPDDPDGPGLLTLVDQGPDDLLPIDVTGRSLVGNSGNDTNGIYGNNSPYLVGGEPHSGNDIYSAAYRDLVAGFAYGFWGSPDYGNDTAQFDVATPPGPFAGAQPNARNYNVWAAALWPLTDAYGFPYGDTFNHTPERNPIVELPTDGTLRITIQPDTSPPNCAGGSSSSPSPSNNSSPSASSSPTSSASPSSTSSPSSSASPISSASPSPNSSLSPTPSAGTSTSPSSSPSPSPSTAPSSSPTTPAATPSAPDLTRPGVPGKPRITRVSRKAVNVRWTPPRNPGTAGLSYELQSKSRSRCSVLATTTATTHDVRLKRAWRGRSVGFRVVAHNSAGSGPPSRAARMDVPGRGSDRMPGGDQGAQRCTVLGW